MARRPAESLLDVLSPNPFEGVTSLADVLHQTEENFYRGAPPRWFNFYISDQRVADGSGTPFIKRDGYNTLVQTVQLKGKTPGITIVKLFHQPGCGGTTLAMKVLWDLRKIFTSAVLTDSASNTTNIAEEVVQLFKDGNRKTVLLLVNNMQRLEALQESIKIEMASREMHVDSRKAAVIILNCVRKDAVQMASHVVFLQNVLSKDEKIQFDEKRDELRKRYGDKSKQFHGFNIIQTNFSKTYIKEACAVFINTTTAESPQMTQLAACLSLLNAYVPGSYLLESQCLDFFKHDDYAHGDFPLKERMSTFGHLIITFQEDRSSEMKVCIAHRMIAQHCTELLAETGTTRSETASYLLTHFNSDEFPSFLVSFIKDMLTKRETKPNEEDSGNGTRIIEDVERFSRLILDIQSVEDKLECVNVLVVASERFNRNAFFPQALARFYSIELKNYIEAEKWAKIAKLRYPQSSFIADTLGQVYKNQLKNQKRDATPRAILELASKAIEAFKDEERLAENESGTETRGDGTTKISKVFNIHGQFGYLDVCNLLYKKLVSQDDTWREVLTKKAPLNSVLRSLGDAEHSRFKVLIDGLKDDIERKCAFFDTYLTYSKPEQKDDPAYISKGTLECYKNFVGNSPSKDFKAEGAALIQKLKENLADTSAGVLSCLDRECRESDLKEITTWWEKIFLQKGSVVALANYILAHIMLRNMEAELPLDCKHLDAFKQKMPRIPSQSPELHMLVLLLSWPTESEANCVLDLNRLIHNMHCSYEVTYKAQFRSRYLRPLFFIGNGEGLNRIVHRKNLEQNVQTRQDWTRDTIFQDATVKARLVRVQGVVRNYRVFATIGGAAIEVHANIQNCLWKAQQVSFYLGFTIRGPVAFDIQTKPGAKDKKGNIREVKHD